MESKKTNIYIYIDTVPLTLYTRHDTIALLSNSQHGFLYIRGWMQMVIAPNDLFSWNNRYNKYSVTNVTNIFTHFLLELCMWTHSVHAHVLKPWRGSLPWPPAISSFCHVFPLPLSGLNWRSLSPLGGPGPSPSKMAPLFTGSAHTPLLGSGTRIISSVKMNYICFPLIGLDLSVFSFIFCQPDLPDG